MKSKRQWILILSVLITILAVVIIFTSFFGMAFGFECRHDVLSFWRWLLENPYHNPLGFCGQ